MIQGASSGVGLMGLQIAKLKGARLVIGTSTNAARRARLKEFGADLAIDTTRAQLVGAGARGHRTARASISSSTRSRPASPTRT